MQLATVGSKFQVVIPKAVRKQIKTLKPGAKVEVSADGKNISINTEPKNWLERTRGMMKEPWKDINTTKYLEDLRNEWDKKY